MPPAAVPRAATPAAVEEPLEPSAVPAETELPCRATSQDLWFSEDPDDLEEAKRRCGDCPLRRACLSGALARGEYCGVWGGEILERGAVIARKRRRGRPSKAELAAAG